MGRAGRGLDSKKNASAMGGRRHRKRDPVMDQFVRTAGFATMAPWRP